MTVKMFYHMICSDMYRQLNDKEEQVVHQDYSTEELEKYIQKQPHNTNYYFCAGYVISKILPDHCMSVEEFNHVLGAVSMFKDLIGLNKYEEYDCDVLREYFSNISKSKLVELCIKLALGDQKTLDEILEEDWDK